VRKNNHFFGRWIAKVMVGPLHPYEHPSLAFKARSNIPAIGEHAAHIPVVAGAYLLIAVIRNPRHAVVMEFSRYSVADHIRTGLQAAFDYHSLPIEHRSSSRKNSAHSRVISCEQTAKL
jgi:hypothetical protein